MPNGFVKENLNELVSPLSKIDISPDKVKTEFESYFGDNKFSYGRGLGHLDYAITQSSLSQKELVPIKFKTLALNICYSPNYLYWTTLASDITNTLLKADNLGQSENFKDLALVALNFVSPILRVFEHPEEPQKLFELEQAAFKVYDPISYEEMDLLVKGKLGISADTDTSRDNFKIFRDTSEIVSASLNEKLKNSFQQVNLLKSAGYTSSFAKTKLADFQRDPEGTLVTLNRLISLEKNYPTTDSESETMRDYKIYCRPKSYFSLYKKVKLDNRDSHDFFALTGVISGDYDPFFGLLLPLMDGVKGNVENMFEIPRESNSKFAMIVADLELAPNMSPMECRITFDKFWQQYKRDHSAYKYFNGKNIKSGDESWRILESFDSFIQVLILLNGAKSFSSDSYNRFRYFFELED